MNNPYWSRVTKIANRQREKGINTYGFGIEDNHELNTLEWITYLEEELVDSLMYLERLRDELSIKPKKSMPNKKALTHKQEEWAYSQWCNGYTMQEVGDALSVSSKVIQRAIHNRPRIKPILEYEFSEDN